MTQYTNRSVFVTGAAKGFGFTLAWHFARHGATVFISSRSLADAQAACERLLAAHPNARLFPLACDLSSPEDIRRAAQFVREHGNALDILIHNGSMWLPQADFATTSDEAIAECIQSGVTGPVMLTKHLLALLEASPAADIVNIVSKCAESGFHGNGAHEAFYAMKHGHAGFADILRARLLDSTVRVLSVYPPDFENTSPLTAEWGAIRADEDQRLLNANSLLETIDFAISQPRSCYISKIYFEGKRRA